MRNVCSKDYQNSNLSVYCYVLMLNNENLEKLVIIVKICFGNNHEIKNVKDIVFLRFHDFVKIELL